MAKPHIIEIVDQALTNGMDAADEIEVRITRGELILFHALLQEHGLEYVGDERFIPLMERHVARMN